MIQTYTVVGMTCNGCKTKVENLLSSLESVSHVTVDLDKSIVSLESNQALSIEVLRGILPEKYSINQDSKHEALTTLKAASKNDLRQLFPLFLIFGYIIIASVLLNKSSWSWNAFMLDFMGLFYVTFSFFKLLDLRGFSKSFKMYDPLAKAIPIYGFTYPFLEVILGLMFLMRFKIPLALVLTLVILGITTIGVTKTLLDKKSIQCACLGTALKLPMTKATFIENTIMIVMALLMLINIYN